jgi:hypothetical protein
VSFPRTGALDRFSAVWRLFLGSSNPVRPVRQFSVLVFVITMMFAPSGAASDARSEAAGDAGTSSRPSDNADETAPLAPKGFAGLSIGQGKT